MKPSSIVGADARRLSGDGYRLVPFSETMVDERYLSWLADDEVTRFLEIRHWRQTRETVLEFVRSFEGPQEKYMWSIQTVPNGVAIGTCTLHSISRWHSAADFGILIGDKEQWGTGASRVAIALLADFTFDVLGLRRLAGGTCARNRGMNFTLRALGFALEGTLREAFRLDDEYVDAYRWGLLSEEWLARRNRTSAR